MPTDTNRVISYSGHDAASAATSLEEALAGLGQGSVVRCVALASHDGMLHGVATVDLIPVVDEAAKAAEGGEELPPVVDDLAAAAA